MLSHLRKTVQDILRTVIDGLNNESVDYIQYKCEGAIGITQLASLVYDIPSCLVNQLEDFLHNVSDICEECNNTTNLHQLGNIFTGSPGRPAFNIPKEILEMFIDNKFTISAMAKMLEVSESTIKRRLQSYGLSISSKYADLRQQDLDDIVKEILEQFPKTGYKRMIGYLMARGHRVQEKKVRETMRRVDPEGVIERSISLNIIQRRRYSVPSTLALWHIDGHHKLIRYIIIQFLFPP